MNDKKSKHLGKSYPVAQNKLNLPKRKGQFYVLLCNATPHNAHSPSCYVDFRRKAWLFANNIQLEQSLNTVYESKIISEATYTRRSHQYTELNLGIAKTDYVKTVICDDFYYTTADS